ncbi:MAG TPA: hypothetical protein VF630_13300 [Hymenobacter sp.]|jgi:hypothetical protein
MRLLAYTALFQDWAARHLDIQHTAANSRFLEISISADPIGRQLDLTDFYNALKSKLKAKAGQAFMVLQNYQVDYDDNGGDHRQRLLNGAFYILRREAPGDVQARKAAIDACEQIAEDILAGVEQQLNATYEVRLNLSDAFAEHIGPIGDGHVGVRMNFSLRAAATEELTFNPDKFLS